MDKEIFKVGDKVFHIEYDWGVIENINGSYYYITFGTYGTRIHCEHNILSFTEYTLQGFSQERPIILPEVGELCLMKDYDSQTWKAVEFKGYDKTKTLPFISVNNFSYQELKRIKILD